MYFGLTNSLVTFQTMMDDIFEELISEGVVVAYLDDILIFTDTLEEHWLVTECVMELMEKHKLYLKPDKCEFEQTTVEYLRVIISTTLSQWTQSRLLEYKNGLSQLTRRKYSLSWGSQISTTDSSKTSQNMPNHSSTLPGMTPNGTGDLTSNQPSTDSSKVSHWCWSSSPLTQLGPSTLKLTALTLPLVQCSLKSALKMANST